MKLLVERSCGGYFRPPGRSNIFVNRVGSPFPENVARAMTCNHGEPGRKFFRVAEAPPRFPGFYQRVLDCVLGFLAVLQDAISDGEKRAALVANDHFKCLPVATNGRSTNFALTGFHHVDLKPRRRRWRFRAK